MSPQVFLIAFILVGTALSADQPQTPQKPTTPAGGVVVVVDPATGNIRQPNASEIGKIVAPATTTAAPKAHAEPALIEGPNGAVGVKLSEDFLTYMVVTTGPDGKLALDCVTGEKAAAARMASPATPAGSAVKAKSTPAVSLQDSHDAQDTHTSKR